METAEATAEARKAAVKAAVGLGAVGLEKEGKVAEAVAAAWAEVARALVVRALAAAEARAMGDEVEAVLEEVGLVVAAQVEAATAAGTWAVVAWDPPMPGP